MTPPSHVAFRFSSLILAAFLGLQCAWILLAELSRPEIERLPTDAQSAARAAKWRNDAAWAAWIGVVRGDFWADSAFTYADLLWANPSSDLTKSLEEAHIRLERTLGYAPHQSGTWLLLAGLASRHQRPEPEPAEALKMSYYTAPSDLRLLPLRLQVATSAVKPGDAEVQLFVRRDLRLLLAQQQKSEVTEAYRRATPEGRRLIEQALDQIDPAYRGLLRSGAQQP